MSQVKTETEMSPYRRPDYWPKHVRENITIQQ